MHQLRFSAGETLISEGTEVQQFIVLFEGEVAGSHRTLRRGDVLGELGIVQTTLSPDTWRAGAGGAVVYAVDRRTLHALLHGAAGRRRQRAANALQDLPMLEGLTKGQLYALVDVMRRAEVPPGAVLNDAFLHILLRGAVRLSDRGALHRGAAAEDEPAGPLTGPVLARAGDAYGEAACLSNGANPLGVCMSSVGDAEIMLCDRDTFARVLGPPEALLLPGAQRKVSLPRPPVARVPGASEAALARGVSAVALASDVIVEDADEEGGAARDASSGGDAAMAQAPPHREGSSAGVDAGVVAAALAAPLVGSSGNRFRTPNQDVTWHGSSAVRQARNPAAAPRASCAVADTAHTHRACCVRMLRLLASVLTPQTSAPAALRWAHRRRLAP
jgi:CRP-like cAMP-binding protein